MMGWIAEWAMRQAFGELWALVWHFGLMGVVLLCALAWAWFMPVFKKTALWVALGAAAALAIAGTYTKLGAGYVQAKWDAAISADIADARRAREDAERDTPPVDDSSAVERVPNDAWDRSNW